MKFRKKPVVIEAMQWTGRWDDKFSNFLRTSFFFENGKLGIYTPEGDITANKGDWIIKGVKGEFYPCKPDIFEATYEAVNE